MLCGKWFFDSSGGNGHALEHYRDMGYPLAVKLGTITPDGAGECAFTDWEFTVGSRLDLTNALIPRAGGCRLWAQPTFESLLLFLISCEV